MCVYEPTLITLKESDGHQRIKWNYLYLSLAELLKYLLANYDFKHISVFQYFSSFNYHCYINYPIWFGSLCLNLFH